MKTKQLSSNWKIDKSITNFLKHQPIKLGALLQDLTCPLNFGIVSRVIVK